ncbi:hypothetical protein [Gordonia alkanivorans]|uniref:hypothetical protein n=1 Tax=Gordonia alkanivorans TaxID=84096 RepID=UPI00244A7323|nr:hypothetical protein [Gordonia alkanivorans]MDH3047212.1 hypothetical protein [Gordonia alkanivorans]
MDTTTVGLVDQHVREPSVRRAPLLRGGTVDHRRPDQRMPEPNDVVILRDDHQVITFGRGQIVESCWRTS